MLRVLGDAALTPTVERVHHMEEMQKMKKLLISPEGEKENREVEVQMKTNGRHRRNHNCSLSSPSSHRTRKESAAIKKGHHDRDGQHRPPVAGKRKRDHESLHKNKNHHHSRSSSYSRSSSGTYESDNDDVGHHPGGKGTIIKNRYVIVKEIGKGTFGKVFHCLDEKHKDEVAVKVVRSIKRYVESARIEADILDHVYDHQARQRKSFCVDLYSHFERDKFYFLVTEKLGPSLYDVLKKNNYEGFPMRIIRSVSRQLLQALQFLKSINLIHTDLKVENVLFVENYSSGTSKNEENCEYPSSYSIKLIDFGGATFDDEKKSTIINTRQYRSPEVLLETGWSFPSDVWSVGCIIGEIYTGNLFFQTHNNLEHLALIEQTCGSFPFRILRDSPLSREYFDSRGRTRLSALDRSSREHVRKMKRIRDVFALGRHKEDRSGIADLVTELLEINPYKRITASEALSMPFFR